MMLHTATTPLLQLPQHVQQALAFAKWHGLPVSGDGAHMVGLSRCWAPKVGHQRFALRGTAFISPKGWEEAHSIKPQQQQVMGPQHVPSSVSTVLLRQAGTQQKGVSRSVAPRV